MLRELAAFVIGAVVAVSAASILDLDGPQALPSTTVTRTVTVTETVTETATVTVTLALPPSSTTTTCKPYVHLRAAEVKADTDTIEAWLSHNDCPANVTIVVGGHVVYQGPPVDHLVARLPFDVKSGVAYVIEILVDGQQVEVHVTYGH